MKYTENKLDILFKKWVGENFENEKLAFSIKTNSKITKGEIYQINYRFSCHFLSELLFSITYFFDDNKFEFSIKDNSYRSSTLNSLFGKNDMISMKKLDEYLETLKLYVNSVLATNILIDDLNSGDTLKHFRTSNLKKLI